MQASYKDIIRIAGPIIAGSIAQSLIGLADTAFLGRVGKVELGAIGIVSIYYLILFLIGFSYTKGTQILVARRIGENRKLSAGKIFDNSMFVIIVMSALLFLFLRFGTKYALPIFIKTNPDMLAAGIEYLEMRSWGIMFSSAGSVFLAFYMGMNRMRILFVSIVVMSIVNIFLNWVLIFGHLGFPKMGMAGAALASNLSEVLAFLIFVAHVFVRKLHIIYGLFRIKKLSVKVIRQITKLSVPIVLQTLIGSVAWFYFFTYVEKMGAQAAAVSSAVKGVYMFFGLPAWGFATSANTVISTLLGEGKQEQVMTAIKKTIILSVGTGILISLFLLKFSDEVMAVFTDDPEIIHASLDVLYVTIIALLVYSASMILFHGIISIGSTNYSLIIQIINVFAYVLFVRFIFSLDNKTLPMVWTVEIFYWGMMTVLTTIYLSTSHWKKVEI